MISEERLVEVIQGGADIDPLILTDMEARALAFVQAQTRRYFGLVAETIEYLPWSRHRTLRLAEPVVEVDSDGPISLLELRAWPGADPTVISEADFTVRTLNPGQPSEVVSMLVFRSAMPLPVHTQPWSNLSEYAVTYSRGYAIDAGPDDIEQLIIALVALELKFKGLEGMRSEVIGGYSYTRFGDGHFDSIDGAWDTINAWRRAVFA